VIRLPQSIRDSLTIRRLEYRIAEFPIYTIPILVECRGGFGVPARIFWEGLLLFGFLLVFGDLTNCLADRDLDAKAKPHLSQAVYRLGPRNVAIQAALSALAALALAVHLSLQLDRWLIALLVPPGLFLAWAYSCPPLRIKGRGAWQLLWYWAALFVSPMVFADLLLRSRPSLEVLLVAGAFATTQTGVLLANTAEDYPEDREAGVRTVVVALGLRRGIGLAFALTSTGAVWLLGTFAVLLREQQATVFGWGSLLPLVITALGAAGRFQQLSATLAGAGESEAIAAIKDAGKWVPFWITSVALGSLLAAFTLYLS
jgi:4-hydroxybenzoate polyprenyltransferase